MHYDQLGELLLQALETEQAGVLIYQCALKCAVTPELADEWRDYLEQTHMHARVVREVLQTFSMNPDQETPGRQAVRHLGQSLVQTMELALKNASPEAAELVAAECVVLAESKDHLNWELIGHAASNLSRGDAEILSNAYAQIEDEEDEHLYHSKGWCRELWLKSLGLTAVIPPPEERKQVRSALEAAQVEYASLESRRPVL
jgi:hypothetical protein